jgi:hypothetical protein
MPSPLPQEALGVEQDKSPTQVREVKKLSFTIVKKDIG